MLKRIVVERIKNRLFRSKAILIYGARQVGKTTLIKQLFEDNSDDVLMMDGDELDDRNALSSTTSSKLKVLIANKKILVIDEAQRIKNIGITLKLVTDKMKDKQVIALGSSSFEIAGLTEESLTGRKYEFYLHPFTFEEMSNHIGVLEECKLLENRLRFGYYPEVINMKGEEEEHLRLICKSYLYKDVLSLDNIKKHSVIENLLKAIALQIGSEVNIIEIAQLIKSDYKTVAKYIHILEEAYIIFPIESYSKNIRNEIRKGKKYYFYDIGIRNAVIGNFYKLESRTDIGALWENYIIAEKLKFNIAHDIDAKLYFWRTTQQQEIDLIEEKADQIEAFEIKYNEKAKKKFSKTFRDAYPNCKLNIINSSNYMEYLLPQNIQENT